MKGTDRRPREYFTEKLHQLLEVLDNNPERRFDYQTRGAPAGSCSARVEQVWVCGSYARGALDCGDLDLVAQIEYARTVPSAGLPPGHLTRRAFWGGVRDVQVFEGEPKINSSHVDMSDHAVLVWKPGMDWRSAIAAIAVSSSAGRFERVIDVLPVDPRRVRMGVSDALQLAHAHALGVITWRWENFVTVPHDMQPITTGEKAAAHWVASARGREAQAVFRPLMATLRRLKGTAGAARGRSTEDWSCDGWDLIWEGYEVQLGYAKTSVDWLARPRAPLGFIVVPYLKRGGPNGLWLIERGPRFGSGMKELQERLFRERGVTLRSARVA